MNGSILQKAKAERRRLILAAIEGIEIPEYEYKPGQPMPDVVRDLIYRLKVDGAYSMCTGDKDIWRSLYFLQLKERSKS